MDSLQTLRGYRTNARLRRALLAALDKWMEMSMRAHLRSRVGFPVDLFFQRELECDRSPRWMPKPDSERSLTIVVVTYRQPDALRCLLDSLLCQTLQNFRVVIIHDGPDAATEQVATSYQRIRPGVFEYEATAERFNDYGHSLRAKVIPTVDTEFVLITNGDNYYSPRFVEMAFEMLKTKELDIVLWDMIHSHSNAGITRNSSYQPFTVYPLRNFVDVGSFIAKTRLAQNAGFRDLTHDGDATYFEDMLSLAGKPLRIGKIQKTLMMHN
jgi:hypothetical protein